MCTYISVYLSTGMYIHACMCISVHHENLPNSHFGSPLNPESQKSQVMSKSASAQVVVNAADLSDCAGAPHGAPCDVQCADGFGSQDSDACWESMAP